MTDPKPGSSLHLYPDDEAPTAKRDIIPANVTCPACCGHGEELYRVDGTNRGGKFKWGPCRLCDGAQKVTAEQAAGHLASATRSP